MFTRYATAASSSIFVTFALLFVMQFLITLQQGFPIKQRIRLTTDWINPETPDTPLKREEIIPKEKLTKTEIEPPRVPYTGAKESIQVPRTTPDTPNAPGLPAIGEFTDGPLVAMVRVAPIYPARAIAREIEGYVVVRFDVTVNGLVKNIVVVESSSSLFNKAAIKAAAKFKFKPRIVDGMAFESYGIQNLFRFSLDAR